MPVHDWSGIEAGIFHDFHHAWIEEIKRALNGGLLPSDYYAMAEQHAAGLEPDVLTLQLARDDDPLGSATEGDGPTALMLSPPRLLPSAESDVDYYRRKQSSVAVRHVSGDRVVAMVEVVSTGNKSSRHAIRAFVRKASALLSQGIHQLILDVHPPGVRDPNGVHGLIWDDFTGQPYTAPADRPLTLVAYEADSCVRAFVVPLKVGDQLPDMPLFLLANQCVEMPLEATYMAAWQAVPRRWREVIDPGSAAASK
jgi:hypothetical protein